jgi:DNA-binding SARP family transcriptional activator
VLWSDRQDSQARSSLRQALVALRHDLAGVDPSPIVVDGDNLAIDASRVMVDIRDFERLAASDAADDLRRAAELYSGDFLDGIAVRDPAFEDWLSLERSRLRELAMTVLDRLRGHLSGFEAIAAAKRLIAFDPLREASHRALMQLHAAQGHVERQRANIRFAAMLYGVSSMSRPRRKRPSCIARSTRGAIGLPPLICRGRPSRARGALSLSRLPCICPNNPRSLSCPSRT